MFLVFRLHVGVVHPGAKLSRGRKHFSQGPRQIVTDAPENE